MNTHFTAHVPHAKQRDVDVGRSLLQLDSHFLHNHARRRNTHPPPHGKHTRSSTCHGSGADSTCCEKHSGAPAPSEAGMEKEWEEWALLRGGA